MRAVPPRASRQAPSGLPRTPPWPRPSCPQSQCTHPAGQAPRSSEQASRTSFAPARPVHAQPRLELARPSRLARASRPRRRRIRSRLRCAWGRATGTSSSRAGRGSFVRHGRQSLQIVLRVRLRASRLGLTALLLFLGSVAKTLGGRTGSREKACSDREPCQSAQSHPGLPSLCYLGASEQGSLPPPAWFLHSPPNTGVKLRSSIYARLRQPQLLVGPRRALSDLTYGGVVSPSGEVRGLLEPRQSERPDSSGAAADSRTADSNRTGAAPACRQPSRRSWSRLR